MDMARAKGTVESLELDEVLLHGFRISSVPRRVYCAGLGVIAAVNFLEENSAYGLCHSPVSYQLAQSIEVH